MPSRDQLSILYSLYRELARIRYGSEDKWAKVSLGHKVTSYFSDAPAAVAGFANRVNKINPMKGDGIAVHPNALRKATIIGNIFAAIVAAYKAEGWEVTP